MPNAKPLPIVHLPRCQQQRGWGVQVLQSSSSQQSPPPEAILTALLNEISALPNNLVLVLDDCHVIDAQAVDQALAFLIEWSDATAMSLDHNLASSATPTSVSVSAVPITVKYVSKYGETAVRGKGARAAITYEINKRGRNCCAGIIMGKKKPQTIFQGIL